MIDQAKFLRGRSVYHVADTNDPTVLAHDLARIKKQREAEHVVPAHRHPPLANREWRQTVAPETGGMASLEAMASIGWRCPRIVSAG